MKEEFIITDFGEPITKPCDETPYYKGTDCVFEKFQYGVWLVSDDNILIEVVEASNDLEYLKNKYKTELVPMIEEDKEK